MKAFILLFFIPSSILFAQQKDHDIIQRQIEAFSKAVVERDVEAISNAYTKDASIFPNRSDIITGREAIKAYWTPRQRNATTFHKIYSEEIVVEGNTAYDYGYYDIEGRTKGVPYPRTRGKYVIVWKKVDGEWKIHLDIWNLAH